MKTSDTEKKRRKGKSSIIRKAIQWMEGGGGGDKMNIGKRIREFLKEKRRVQVV